MKAYHDPFALSLALFRLSGYAVATQMRCASVLARSAMDFATFRPWQAGVAASQAQAAPPPAPQPAPKPAQRRGATPTKAPAVAKPRLVVSADLPATAAAERSRHEPSTPRPMPVRAATGTDGEG